MAKKTLKRKKVAKKSLKVGGKSAKYEYKIKNNNEIEYLERLIELSLRNITGKSEQLDQLFGNQVHKMRDQITKLKLES